MRKLDGAVVVVLGASSGIGRATARLFAERGAKLVVASRSGRALDDVVAVCERAGAEAIAVPVDVRDEVHVRALRDAAVQRFERIDVWVNVAGVYMLGDVEDVPSEDVRALIETNFMGVVHGTKAALSQFRKQGGGTVIQLGSMAGKVSYAKASAYCASKHAVHGFNEALRQELVGTNIQACLVVPATVDTPFFDHAANYTGRVMRVAPPPVYRPERVARAIVRCAIRPRREVRVGVGPTAATLFARILPRLFERLAPGVIERRHFVPKPMAQSSGNITLTLPPYTEDGGWRRGRASVVERLPGASTVAATAPPASTAAVSAT